MLVKQTKVTLEDILGKLKGLTDDELLQRWVEYCLKRNKEHLIVWDVSYPSELCAGRPALDVLNIIELGYSTADKYCALNEESGRYFSFDSLNDDDSPLKQWVLADDILENPLDYTDDVIIKDFINI